MHPGDAAAPSDGLAETSAGEAVESSELLASEVQELGQQVRELRTEVGLQQDARRVAEQRAHAERSLRLELQVELADRDQAALQRALAELAAAEERIRQLEAELEGLRRRIDEAEHLAAVLRVRARGGVASGEDGAPSGGQAPAGLRGPSPVPCDERAVAQRARLAAATGVPRTDAAAPAAAADARALRNERAALARRSLTSGLEPDGGARPPDQRLRQTLAALRAELDRLGAGVERETTARAIAEARTASVVCELQDLEARAGRGDQSIRARRRELDAPGGAGSPATGGALVPARDRLAESMPAPGGVAGPVRAREASAEPARALEAPPQPARSRGAGGALTGAPSRRRRQCRRNAFRQRSHVSGRPRRDRRISKRPPPTSHRAPRREPRHPATGSRPSSGGLSARIRNMAGQLLLALLPAQAAVHRQPLAYDLILGPGECVRVTVRSHARQPDGTDSPQADSSEQGSDQSRRGSEIDLASSLASESSVEAADPPCPESVVEFADSPRAESEVDFQVLGELASVARTVAAGRLRRRFGRGMAHVIGDRAAFAALRDLVGAPLGVRQLRAAGVRLEAPLALTVVSLMVDRSAAGLGD